MLSRHDLVGLEAAHLEALEATGALAGRA